MIRRAKKISEIEVLSTLTDRQALAGRLSGQTFNGSRNMYNILGYPTRVTFLDIFARYLHQDMAKAIIDRPVKKTWEGELNVLESDDDKETAFEKEFKTLYSEFKLKSIFARIDRLTGLGKYGILFLGLDDVKTLEDYAQPVATGKRKLVYLRPFSEEAAKIASYETDPVKPRFGKPLIYQLTFAESNQTSSVTINVHYTRVLHMVDDILESEIEGSPRLEAVFNRLIDLEKLVGGSAEMFWKGAYQGFAGTLDNDYELTPEAKQDFKDQITEYEMNLRRFLINKGLNINPLSGSIESPKEHVDVQIQMISAVTGIPKRVLVGSERGELSSSQDSDEWKSWTQSRREEYAEPMIVRPLIDRFIELQILPKPVIRYSVKWANLFSQSDKDKAEIGKTKAAALKEYASALGAEDIIPREAFLEFFLGMTDDQIALINEMRDKQIEEEKAMDEEEEDLLSEEDLLLEKQRLEQENV